MYELVLVVLQTWFYEKFQVNQIDPSISYVSREKLLIQHWDDVKASKVDKINCNNPGVGEVKCFTNDFLFSHISL
jgi:hypothetical protein